MLGCEPHLYDEKHSLFDCNLARTGQIGTLEGAKRATSIRKQQDRQTPMGL